MVWHGDQNGSFDFNVYKNDTNGRCATSQVLGNNIKNWWCIFCLKTNTATLRLGMLGCKVWGACTRCQVGAPGVRSQEQDRWLVYRTFLKPGPACILSWCTDWTGSTFPVVQRRKFGEGFTELHSLHYRETTHGPTFGFGIFQSSKIWNALLVEVVVKLVVVVELIWRVCRWWW